MKKKNNNLKKQDPQITEEQKLQLKMARGFIAAVFSKVLLESSGCEVNFRINGEDINDIEKLNRLDITERIELAVKEERYEDAAKLKKLLETKSN